MRLMSVGVVLLVMTMGTALAQETDAVVKANRDEIIRVTQGLQEGSEKTARIKDAEFLTRARELIAGIMKDPDAVQFRAVKLHRVGDIRFVCGEYNAKNGFGAYVGYKAFMTDTNDMTVMQGQASHYMLGLLMAGVGGAEAEAMPNPAMVSLCR